LAAGVLMAGFVSVTAAAGAGRPRPSHQPTAKVAPKTTTPKPRVRQSNMVLRSKVVLAPPYVPAL